MLIEASRTNPNVIELTRQVRYTHAFLRMAAIELRRIGERAPDIAVALQHLAQKLEAEPEDLARDTQSKPNSAIRAQA
jgi:hypothetical protein